MFNNGMNRPAQCRSGEPEDGAFLHPALRENAARTPLQAPRLTPNAFQTEENKMTSSEIEKTQIRFARFAGFMYLFTYVAPFTVMIITGRFEVPNDFAETAHRIMGAELLYRFGLSCQLITSVCCIFLAMGLYMTVKPINNNLALFALLFRLAESTLGCASGILSFVVLNLYLGAHSANAFNATLLSVFMNLFTGARSIEFNVAMVLLGIGSILFFYLFLKSSYIPKVLSAWSLFASALFTLVSFAFLLFPQYSKILQLGWLPMGVAEIAVGLWLLLKGVNLRTQGSGIKNSVAAQSSQ
jgi:hypothetical protein